MRNGLEVLVSVVDELLDHGFDAAVFGGWAEELLELRPPREHKDIDLLIIDADVAALDRFVASRGEIELKRFSHKRAYVHNGILIELFLVRTGDNRRTTLFFDTLSYEWPAIGCVLLSGLPVASAASVTAFRRDYEVIEVARPRP
jgi:hypothetical protein